ncbi:polysaccharide biosynthesis protein [Antrihabitans cavernicola]|uniref:Polysaccharide biosynthesis protein n=1 Tax=Antrihabitans cavernicola TaxID=2495913 RepID=A0A5A7S614_9NOCA|nr:polysaccharide biosynthesis protein [Spelaeibacter cavernicola]KAA0017396.1 polysaccharide biosynthesis protein [Spelaeibacter cavernicola]
MSTRPVDRSAVAGMTMVTAGSMTANVAGYLLQVLASRWLGPAGYSEFATLLGAQLVLAVPALALQTVVARELVHGASADYLRRLERRCAAIVAVVAAVLVPVIASVFDVDVIATVAALLAVPVLVLLAGEQGLLQGSGRFKELALVLGFAGVAKVTPGVVVLALGGGAAPALVVCAIGIGVAAAFAQLIAGRVPRDGEKPAVSVTSVLTASQVQLALIAMSSADLLIARIVLTEHDSGLYALGAVATKAAFWLPQAVGVVLYPRMAHPDHSARAVRSALAVLVGLGAVMVIGVALAAPLAPLIVGDDYRPIQGRLWAFALDGACLALLQGALLAAIAGKRTRLALIAWVGLGVEVLLMLTLAASVTELISIAVATAAVTAVVACIPTIGPVHITPRKFRRQ